jgi:hypothetical protein
LILIAAPGRSNFEIPQTANENKARVREDDAARTKKRDGRSRP